MKKSMKFISLLLAVVFLIAGTVMIASADEETGGGSGGDTPIDTPVDPNPTPVDPDPTPVDPDPTPVDPNPTPDPDPNPTPDPDPNPDYTGGGTVDGGSTTDDGGSTYTPSNNDDPVFFGDASQYDYNTGNSEASAGSVKQQTNLYNTSGLSDSEVAPNKWSEITLDEKTTSVPNANASFASIKNNTGREDDSQWILFLGYALIALAVLGILYFIIATVTARSANKKRMQMQAERAYAPAPEESVKRTSHAQNAPRHRASAKADTGEIYVPRRSRAK